MEERREELVGRTVEQAKRVVDETKRLASTQARLGAEELRDVLAPARPSLEQGAIAAALAVAGAGLVALPVLRRMAGHPLLCGLVGGAAVGLSLVFASQAYAEFPPDLRERIRDLLRTDLEIAVDAATAP